jgi:hypothetical protein
VPVFFRRFDLTADKIEIVLRLGFAVALQLSVSASPQMAARFNAAEDKNFYWLKKLDPTGPGTCLAAVNSHFGTHGDPARALQVMQLMVPKYTRLVVDV